MNTAVPLPGDSRAVSGTRRTLSFSPRGIAVSSGGGSGSILQLRVDWRSPVQTAVGATAKLHLSPSQSTFSPSSTAFLPTPSLPSFSPLRNAEQCPPEQRPGREIKTPVRCPSALRTSLSRWAGDPEPEGSGRRRDSRPLPASPAAPSARRRCHRGERALRPPPPRSRQRCPAAPVLPRLPGARRKASPLPTHSAAPAYTWYGEGPPRPALLLRAPLPSAPAPRRRGGSCGGGRGGPRSRRRPAGPSPWGRWARRGEREGRGKPLSPPLPTAKQPPPGSARQTGDLSDTSDRSQDRLRKLVFQHLTQVKPQCFETQGGRERGAWEWRDFIPNIQLWGVHRS